MPTAHPENKDVKTATPLDLKWGVGGLSSSVIHKKSRI